MKTFEIAGLPSDEVKSTSAIQQDFDSKRQQDALLRTVMSPDGQRALALYGTADEPATTFRIDLYSADGNFLRNVTPPTLAVVFQDSVAWSADSSMIAFVEFNRRKLWLVVLELQTSNEDVSVGLHFVPSL